MCSVLNQQTPEKNTTKPEHVFQQQPNSSRQLPFLNLQVAYCAKSRMFYSSMMSQCCAQWWLFIPWRTEFKWLQTSIWVLQHLLAETSLLEHLKKRDKSQTTKKSCFFYIFYTRTKVSPRTPRNSTTHRRSTGQCLITTTATMRRPRPATPDLRHIIPLPCGSRSYRCTLRQRAFRHER